MAPMLEKYRLLSEDESSSNSEEPTGHEYLSRRDDSTYKFSKGFIIITGSLFISALVTNVILALTLRKTLGKPSRCVTPIAGLEDNHPTAWQASTQYIDPNITESDRAWINLDIDHVVVALTKEYAKEKGLPDSADFPWDSTYSAYMVTSFHSLHCLKSLHRSNLEYRHNVPQSYHPEHLMHCLDNIRQDIMCAADDTPRYIPVDADGNVPTGVGQYRQCKDWSKLEKWADENSACFSYNEVITHELNEENPYPHALRYCPAGNKWLPTIQKFYNKPDDWVPTKPPPPYPDVGI